MFGFCIPRPLFEVPAPLFGTDIRDNFLVFINAKSADPVPGQLGGPAVGNDEALIRRVGEDVVDARGGGRVGVGNEGDVAPDAPDLPRVMEVDEGRVARRASVAGIAGPFDFLVAGQRPQVDYEIGRASCRERV